MSLPLALLSPERRVEKVIPINVGHDLPSSAATRIADAIDRVSVLVEDLIKPLAERLTNEYARTSPATIASWPIPAISHDRAEQFSADSRRRKRPGFTLYWDSESVSSDSE